MIKGAILFVRLVATGVILFVLIDCVNWLTDPDEGPRSSAQALRIVALSSALSVPGIALFLTPTVRDKAPILKIALSLPVVALAAWLAFGVFDMTIRLCHGRYVDGAKTFVATVVLALGYVCGVVVLWAGRHTRVQE